MRSLDLSSLGKKGLICMDLFGIILIYLSKIYDCSPHNPLIAKLEAYGLEKKNPNGHTTSNRRRFQVDIMSICQRPNFNEFPHCFHVLFSV